MAAKASLEAETTAANLQLLLDVRASRPVPELERVLKMKRQPNPAEGPRKKRLFEKVRMGCSAVAG